jgi:hypothetical protein
MTASVPASGSPSRAAAIADLRKRLAASRAPRSRQRIVPTGLAELDAVLPAGGLPTAALIEWIADQPGSGVFSTALQTARGVLNRPGALVVVDAAHDFNPVVLPSLGIPLDRLLLIRPQTVTRRPAARTSSDISPDALWSLEQSVRCPGVALVVCRLGRASQAVLRRLQLAVERSGVTVVLIRPPSVMTQPSFADVRILMSHGRCQVLRTDPLATSAEPEEHDDSGLDRTLPENTRRPSGRRA